MFSTIYFVFRMLDLHVNVYLCNVVRAVTEGKPLVSPILDIVKNADSCKLAFLIEVSIAL